MGRGLLWPPQKVQARIASFVADVPQVELSEMGFSCSRSIMLNGNF